MRAIFALSIALAAATGCASAKSTKSMKLIGVSSVAVDPKDDGIVYVVKDGAPLRCTKAKGGTEFDNCKDVPLKSAQ